MDNVYFKKLPSNVIPSVSGDDVVIVETNGGKLYWVDSGGAKQLISVDDEHPVNSHYIQFYGDPTPGEKYGGTWSIDSDYTGRTLVFSGTGFTIGATGGVSTHIHQAGNLGALIQFGGNYIRQKNHNVDDTWSPDYNYNPTMSEITGGISSGSAVDIVGETAEANNMPPYLVCAMWKRIA